MSLPIYLQIPLFIFGAAYFLHLTSEAAKHVTDSSNTVPARVLSFISMLVGFCIAGLCYVGLLYALYDLLIKK